MRASSGQHTGNGYHLETANEPPSSGRNESDPANCSRHCSIIRPQCKKYKPVEIRFHFKQSGVTVMLMLKGSLPATVSPPAYRRSPEKRPR